MAANYLKFINVYEFHPAYLRYSTISLFDEKVSVCPIYTLDMWDSTDVEEVKVFTDTALDSCEIQIRKKITSPIQWRGQTFWKIIYYAFFPLPVNLVIGSMKVKSTPYLHTRAEIVPGIQLHLGINMAPYQKEIEKDLCVVALPPGTKITELFGFLPHNKISFQGWTLLIYNRKKIDKNVSAHFRFILPEKDTLQLPLLELFEKLKE